MSGISIQEEQDRVRAEIEALERWYEDLARYIESGLRDPSISQEEFSIAATVTTRVLMRLKALHDRVEQS